VVPCEDLGGLFLGEELVFGDQKVSADFEGGDLVFYLLLADCLLRCDYASLPPLTIQTKRYQQYTEQGPMNVDFRRVFRFC
jgi:hypothetical protein